jgi:hypothetical protein
MPVLKYNPRRVTGSFKGSVNGRDFAIQFSAYMDGSKVSAEYEEDAVTKHVGDDGEVSLVLNCNRGATVTIMLSQGSPSNKPLSDLVPNGKLDYLPIGVLSFDDLNGSTHIKAQEAWIKKSAKVEFAKSITGRSWTFDTADCDIDVGGAEEG